ncbi:MAG: EamA family transporter RarD [Erythrobacter sp.]
MSEHDPKSDRTGLGAAFGAYLIWGFLPLYLIYVQSVPALEFVGWRIIWTLPLCLLIVAFRKQWPDVRLALGNRKVMGWLALSATLVAVNWVVYVWAIQHGNIYAASLGYYINPLVNVLLGTVVLGERLSRLQWAAVGLAAVGVSLLLGGALTTLWISLTLALSFGTYGLIRKQVPVGSLPGLTIESALLLVPALAVIWHFALAPAGSAFTRSIDLSLIIMMGGALTAFPLLLFAIAARKLPYSTIGFIQFLAPSIVFVLGLTIFGEELKPVQAACFGFIWAAAAIFAWDLVSRSRKPVAS